MKSLELSFPCPVTPACPGSVELEIEHDGFRFDEPIEWNVKHSTECDCCRCVPDLDELDALDALDSKIWDTLSRGGGS